MMLRYLFVEYVILTSFIKICMSEEMVPPPCFSQIYCHGRLLNTIQMSKIYEDSKTFVDMKLRLPPNQTLQLFDKFMLNFSEKPKKSDIIEFVNEYFEEVGTEFEHWDPRDWVPHPKFIDTIEDSNFKEWGIHLNAIWKTLGRKIKEEVKDHQELYSIIWVPNPMIVPGGRFREIYYWDSYWIVQGLLLSEMFTTVKGVLENFLYMIDHYGHIPNGGRIYYLARSQPPLLIPMIKLYLEFTKDKKFIEDNIHFMEKEFDFWLTNHTQIINVNGVNHTLALYGDRSHGPRPESYFEDMESAAYFKDISKREAFFSELKAGAESGWDFSSRWFITNATNKGNLTNIKTRSIVPVDLNAIMCWNAGLLAEFHRLLGNHETAENYSNIALNWMKAVQAVLWHEAIGSWLDYDIHNHIRRYYFYPTNIAPLWTGCYNTTDKRKIVRNVLKYLQNNNILYSGGIPSTVEHTGEQWDYPNAWPPLQHLMIIGLNNTENNHANRLAYEIAEKWVRTNYLGYKQSDVMFEKYDATVPGGHGGGGEYELQLGFGWTNGVIMDLLRRYSDRLTVENPSLVTKPAALVHVVNAVSSSRITSITTVLIALLAFLTAAVLGYRSYFYCCWCWRF